MIEHFSKEIKCAQLASYKKAHRKVRAKKKTHTNAENLILRTALDIAAAFEQVVWPSKLLQCRFQMSPSAKMQEISKDQHQQLQSSMTCILMQCKWTRLLTVLI